MKHLNRLDGDAGFPQRHAQSLQWWSTRRGLVSVPGTCIQMDANTYVRGVRGRGGLERKGKGKGKGKGERKDPSNVVFTDAVAVQQSRTRERADFNDS